MAESLRIRIRRRLFASVSVLSLICCLATVGLWVRSYSVYDDLQYASDGAEKFSCWTVAGRIAIRCGRGLWPEDHHGWRYDSGPPSREARISLGITRSSHLAYFPNSWILGLPLWLPALLFALAPSYWLLGPYRRQWKRRKLGLCLTCGYDLRATPERCPECGGVSE